MRQLLLISLVSLLIPVAARAEDDDPRTMAFQRYRAESLRRVFSDDDAMSGERVIALRGLVRHDCAATVNWLMLDVLAKTDEGDVQRQVVKLLTGYMRPTSVEEMGRIWETKFKKNIRAKTLATLAFGRKKTSESRRVLKLALKHKDPRVIAAACRSIGKGDDDTFKPELIALLKHKVQLVRADAALALGELFEVDARPLVFNVFCTDKSRFVKYQAWRAMRKLLPKSKLPCDVQAWRGWWEEQVSELLPDAPNPWGKDFPGKRDTTKATLWFGIPILADRIVFVVDSTTRMDSSWKLNPVKERKKPKAERVPNYFSVKTRYGLQTAYLNDTLKKMPDKQLFAVAYYHDTVAPPNFSVLPENNKWLKLSKKTRALVATNSEELVPAGTSSMYEGIQAAWDFAVKKKPVKNGVQMICFLTCGKPTGGEFKDKPDRIMGEVWAAAQERGIVIQAVGLHHHAFDILKDFAKESGGLYVHRQQEGDTVEPQDLDFWPAKKAAFEAARKKTRGKK